MNRIFSIFTVTVLAILVSGCASTAAKTDDPYYASQDKTQTQKLHADLVREMIAQGRYYAALAHIEELEKAQGPSDELRLLKAQVLSELGRRREAEQSFSSLLNGPFEGEARHGLGLLYAESNYPLSLKYMQVAANMRPTNAEIRNDLGYALLMGGYYQEARLQLATAYELDAAAERNRNNYVLSLLLLKDDAAVQRLQRAGAISAQQVEALRKKARVWPQTVQRSRAAVPRNPSTAPAGRTPATSVVRPQAKTESMSVKEKLRAGNGR